MRFFNHRTIFEIIWKTSRFLTTIDRVARLATLFQTSSQRGKSEPIRCLTKTHRVNPLTSSMPMARIITISKIISTTPLFCSKLLKLDLWVLKLKWTKSSSFSLSSQEFHLHTKEIPPEEELITWKKVRTEIRTLIIQRRLRILTHLTSLELRKAFPQRFRPEVRSWQIKGLMTIVEVMRISQGTPIICVPYLQEINWAATILRALSGRTTRC